MKQERWWYDFIWLYIYIKNRISTYKVYSIIIIFYHQATTFYSSLKSLIRQHQNLSGRNFFSKKIFIYLFTISKWNLKKIQKTKKKKKKKKKIKEGCNDAVFR